ncbi:MAG: GH92 family glycosyl hydrolase [Bacteroidia bacterium]|nr:GH92 family glycosyl hydrolase [Bacteroidia bacterium]
MGTLAAQDVAALVNPLMGSDSGYLLSHGNTYPAIARPWGMHAWTPQTGKMGDGWIYTYDAARISGIRQTHQPSPWIGDYGAFALMPMTGELKFREEERASWFSHKAETARPDYYSVYLADYDVRAELTPAERAAALRITYPATDQAWLLLDAFDEGSMVRIIPEARKIIGYARNHSGGVPGNFHNYFVAEFDRDFEQMHTWRDSVLTPGSLHAEGHHTGAVLGFRMRAGEQLHIRIASSFISLEQAELSLRRETGAASFDELREAARTAWNQELARIRVEGGTEAQQRTFYSCLYRCLLFPRKFYELDSAGQVLHYSPYNGEVRPGYMFTDNGFWDTFRAVFPFFTLMYPELDAQILEGMAHAYAESGWLPEWASPGHRDCMIGSNSASLIADAYLKGIRGFDIETLYEAMVRNTQGHGPVSSVGRYGAEYYNTLGYVPCDTGIRESAARTLEYAYADFCLWKLAQALGRPQAEIDLYARRAQQYREVFHPERKLMCGRRADGTFLAPFNPLKWGDAFTEGNSWHYTWSVFHDVEGLIGLMGGREAFTARLDSVFTLPPVFDESYYGFVIHEIREMQIAGMGNYAHGNQPIQHMIYLYAYAGQPWKTQYWVREVLERLYTPAADGYCGDEDNGQTSAWYVFSALGFYPVCPGSGQYVLGSPLFDRVTLSLPQGRTLRIEAEHQGPGRRYADAVRWNGKRWDRQYLDHAELVRGGRLQFRMSETPSLSRGTAPQAAPYSMRQELR